MRKVLDVSMLVLGVLIVFVGWTLVGQVGQIGTDLEAEQPAKSMEFSAGTKDRGELDFVTLEFIQPHQFDDARQLLKDNCYGSNHVSAPQMIGEDGIVQFYLMSGEHVVGCVVAP